MAFALGHEIGLRAARRPWPRPPAGCAGDHAEAYGVREENWRRRPGPRTPLRHLRDPAVHRPGRRAAPAADPYRVARFNGSSLSPAAAPPGSTVATDLDGSRPDAWRYLVEVQDAGKLADRHRIPVKSGAVPVNRLPGRRTVGA